MKVLVQLLTRGDAVFDTLFMYVVYHFDSSLNTYEI